MFSPRALWRLWKRTLIVFAVLGVSSLALGASMNVLVEHANKGLMPVVDAEVCGGHAGALLDRRHFCAAPDTNLILLSDWIVTEERDYSPGDFVGIGGDYLCFTAGFALLLSSPLFLLEWTFGKI